MHRLATMLLGTTSLIAFAGAGFAADMSPRMVTKAPPVAPVATMPWTGCYIGGHAGGAWGRKDVNQGATNTEFGFSAFRDDIDGFFGGVQAGCDYQFHANWVIGIEGQYSWSDIKGDITRDPFFSTKGGGNATFSVRMDRFANVTGRLGYTAGPWMIYVKGGAAWARDHYSLVGTALQSSLSAAATQTRAGFIVGGGFEYHFLANVSAKIEYAFMDFGRESSTLVGEFGSGQLLVPVSIDQRIHTVKIGLNYRFGTGAGPMRY